LYLLFKDGKVVGTKVSHIYLSGHRFDNVRNIKIEESGDGGDEQHNLERKIGQLKYQKGSM
jgi:hypothetical protein